MAHAAHSQRRALSVPAAAQSRCLSLAAAVLYQSSVEGIFTPSCQPGAHRGVPGKISPMVWGVRCAAVAVRVARQSFVEVA